MRHYGIRLKAVSPLAIRSDHAPGGSETARFISGSTFMGALASVHRLLRKRQRDEFESFFLSGNVHYPNLYPAMFADKNMQGADNLPVYPFPGTAQSCKRFPGFRHKFFKDEKEATEEQHGVRDTLFDWALFELVSGGMGNTEANTAGLGIMRAYHKECKYPISTEPEVLCGEAMDTYTGYYRRHALRGYMIAAKTDNTRLQTHTGINREWNIVEEGILYNREVIEEGTVFWGLAKVTDEDELPSAFEDYIIQANREQVLHIGTGRTRGLGSVEFKITELYDEEERQSQFEQRVEEFNEAFQEEAKRYLKPEKLKPFYFALTLHSPTILCDDYFRYWGSLDVAALEQLIQLPNRTFELIYKSASGRRISGWNDLWGTPKTNEYAIDTGSVFLFSSPVGVDQTLLDGLFKLEEEGIGQRRSEGFGQVCISDPCHLIHLKGELQ